MRMLKSKESRDTLILLLLKRKEGRDTSAMLTLKPKKVGVFDFSVGKVKHIISFFVVFYYLCVSTLENSFSWKKEEKMSNKYPNLLYLKNECYTEQFLLGFLL
jgi:hypothetical protein